LGYFPAILAAEDVARYREQIVERKARDESGERAYTLPSGVGETEALRPSEEMAHDADLWLRRSPAARSHLPSVPRPSDHAAIYVDLPPHNRRGSQATI